MGQSLDTVVKTCDADEARNRGVVDNRPGRPGESLDSSGSGGPGRPRQSYSSHTSAGAGNAQNNAVQDLHVSCNQAVESSVTTCISTAQRGSNQMNETVLRNHELLQHARCGNARGITEALDAGAWTETRRPLVMRPQKEDRPQNHHDTDGGDIGMTALMFSAQAGSTDCVKRLLWANAQINAVEEDGWTPLHFAAKEGHVDVCRTLLVAKADPNLPNADGQPPLGVAEEGAVDVLRRVTKIE